jgi:hypothetical protein
MFFVLSLSKLFEGRVSFPPDKELLRLCRFDWRRGRWSLHFGGGGEWVWGRGECGYDDWVGISHSNIINIQ